MSGSGFLERQQDVAPVDHPWAGSPRRFSALAMPAGDPRFGVAGELIQVQTYRGGGDPKLQLLSRAEAEQLLAELHGALRCFDHARALVDGLAPRAATGSYPFAGHRTLAEIDGADCEHVAQDAAFSSSAAVERKVVA